MDCLQDFAIFGHHSYSFNLVARFTQKKIAQVNLKKGTKLSPGKVVLNYIVKKLLVEKEFKQLVIVFHGNMVESFAHAACFIYQKYYHSDQFLLLDSKNKLPLVYPKQYSNQVAYGGQVNWKEDIEGEVYDRWDIYSLDKRLIENESERQHLMNKMMHVLTGD